jgi:hypothetical protein
MEYRTCRLGALSADTTGELDILGHDGDTLGVDSTKVRVFEKANKVRFGGFLERKHGGSLESEIRLEILGNLTNQTLERKLADKQVGRLLVPTDFSERNGSGPVTVRLLHSSSRRGRLTGSLGGKLLTRSLASSRLTGGLLGTGHLDGS